MKKSVKYSIAVVIIIIVGIFSINFIQSNTPSKGTATSFNYAYGSYNGGYWDYSVYTENESTYFLASGSNGVDLNINVQVDKSVLVDLTKIVMDYKVWKWDGFRKQDDNVIDGYSFYLKVVFENDTISAYGYMKEPKNYEQVHEVLESYFEELVLQIQSLDQD